jgi:hypothetical protein
MISTVSLSFDLSASPPRVVVTDSTTYPFAVDLFSAKGYGVLTFNGDVVEAKDTVINPLINLEAFETTGFINLPLDNNGNVANGVYGFEYSLRLDSTASGVGYVGTVTGGTTFTSAAEWLVEVLPIGSSIAVDGVNNTVAGAVVVGSDAVITLGTVAANGPAKPLTFINDVSVQFSATYAYAGCTQTTADVDFIYDCDYLDSGTWSVSNTTVLGSNEIIVSESCTINYPSWTNIDPLFNPQIVTTSLPYPTLPTEDTPLATGTYSILLSELIQQTQTSGLVVTYTKSVTKEFTVSCAGTLCGLVPCIENLRAAHAAELVRNKVSKYQVYVDNVALYYLEAMNYKACGELDKYKSTIALLEAQLDASGCECACCDDETYYWVSNNSANSIIDELLANFQYRLFAGTGDPGPAQAGVEYGAIWQNTNTGVLYRCIDATPSNLQWEVYYDPNDSILSADNGLTELSGTVGLGGTLNRNTTIARGAYNLILSGTTGNVSVTGGDTSPSLSVTNTAAQAFSTQGAHSSGSATLATLDTSGSAVTPSPTLTLAGVAFAPGNGYGTSIEFTANGATGFPTGGAMSTIKSTWSNATTLSSKLEFTTMNSDVESTALTLNADGKATLNNYGAGTYTGTPTYSLSVDVDGNIIESNQVSGALNGLSTSGDNVKLGGTLTESTTIDVGANFLSYPITTGFISVSKSTTGFPAMVVSGVDSSFASQATGNLAGVFAVNRTSTDNTVAKNIKVQTGTSGTVGNGFGASVEFALENTTGLSVTTSSIKSSWEDAANQNSKIELTTANNGVESTFFTLNSVGSTKLSSYGTGAFTGTPTHSLSVDSAGNVIETPAVPVLPKVYVATLTQTGSVAPTATEILNTTGQTITWTRTGTGEYTATITGNAFTASKTSVFINFGGYAAVTPYDGLLINVQSKRTSTSTVEVKTLGLPRGGSIQLDDGLLNVASIRIEIYP